MGTTRQTSRPIRSVAFVSLGCAKNLVDSEKMLGLLAEAGLAVAADEAEADVIVINTCGFLEAAKEESLEVIRQAARYKQEGRCRRLVVVGCLVQRHRARLLEWCPQIDALLGVFDRDLVVQAVCGPGSGHEGRQGGGGTRRTDRPVYRIISASAAAARRRRGEAGAAGYDESDQARLRLTPRHWAYLRIAEGCNQACSFCTIPAIRGKLRSKPLRQLLEEAAELLADGAFELNLIGQDTTSYGRDIGYNGGLAGLLGELEDLADRFGGAWLRLMYAYPACVGDDLIDTLARRQHLLAYLDLPLQHICDDMLEAMRRRTTRRHIEALLERLRHRVPSIALRTTFISGFPGETDAHHRQLVDFIKQFQFDHVGVFAFSAEPGTVAARLARTEAVPAAVVEQRVEELMLAQQEVVFERNRRWAEQGKVVQVLIDGPVEMDEQTADERPGRRAGRWYVGRAECQAPEIDPVTYVQAGGELVGGQVVRCVVVGSRDYDLVARPADEGDQGRDLPVL